MRKIERLSPNPIFTTRELITVDMVFREKINELVDGFNWLWDITSVAPKQTQEPEMKEPDEVIYCDECGSKLPVDETWKQGRDEQAMHTALKPKSNKRGGSPCPAQEPECEHKNIDAYSWRCGDCGKFVEKPAKKECEHDNS